MIKIVDFFLNYFNIRISRSLFSDPVDYGKLVNPNNEEGDSSNTLLFNELTHFDSCVIGHTNEIHPAGQITDVNLCFGLVDLGYQ